MSDLAKNLLLLLTTKEPAPSTGEILEYHHGDSVVSVSLRNHTELKVWPNADPCGSILGVYVACPKCVDAFAIAQCKATKARQSQLESSLNSTITKLIAS